MIYSRKYFLPKRHIRLSKIHFSAFNSIHSPKFRPLLANSRDAKPLPPLDWLCFSLENVLAGMTPCWTWEKIFTYLLLTLYWGLPSPPLRVTVGACILGLFRLKFWKPALLYCIKYCWSLVFIPLIPSDSASAVANDYISLDIKPPRVPGLDPAPVIYSLIG